MSGRFVEAATGLRDSSAGPGASADGYCLLGVVFDALGDQHALPCRLYRKALFISNRSTSRCTDAPRAPLTAKPGAIPGANACSSARDGLHANIRRGRCRGRTRSCEFSRDFPKGALHLLDREPPADYLRARSVSASRRRNRPVTNPGSNPAWSFSASTWNGFRFANLCFAG